MKIPHYWVKEQRLLFKGEANEFLATCWGDSDESEAKAREKAKQKLENMSHRLSQGESLDNYLYSDRPIKEEIIKEYTDADGEVDAMVTRNNYGALVLNTQSAMFIDIDDKPQSSSIGAWFKSVFFGQKPVSSRDLAIDALKAWHQTHPSWGFRVYETFKGLRALVTHDLFSPQQSDVQKTLQTLGADPIYLKLCKAQDCFRARLTPKPWRLNMDNFRNHYPKTEAEERDAFLTWLSNYEDLSYQYATCHLLETIGSSQIHPRIKSLIDIHDRYTQAMTEKSLA